jgi:hypothetical protein
VTTPNNVHAQALLNRHGLTPRFDLQEFGTVREVFAKTGGKPLLFKRGDDPVQIAGETWNEMMDEMLFSRTIWVRSGIRLVDIRSNILRVWVAHRINMISVIS